MKKVTDTELLKALVYCRNRDGDLCGMCAYSAIAGGECSNVLLREARDRIKELIKENEELKKEIANEHGMESTDR